MFVLGHAPYMKAVHGGKTKNDKIKSYKIAKRLRGGTLSIAYPYPAKMRGTCDLLRHRNYIVNKYSLLMGHILTLVIYTHKLGLAIYFMLKKAFDMKSISVLKYRAEGCQLVA